jgi:tRNA pseudouridine38-40 synthase
VQPGRRTVQGEIQGALAAVLRLPNSALTVAGRTDAGVHATGQVAHLDVPNAIWADAEPWLLRRANRFLPADVRIEKISAAPAGFDARFSALWRRYEYRIWDGASGAPPLRRREVLAWPRRLDATVMCDAAAPLTGLHDFVAFCRHRPGGTTVRTMHVLDIARNGDEVVCTVKADAFCHSMVRSLVGALVAVGEHRRPPDWPATLLAHGRRADDVGVVAAHGLTLVEVGYPPDGELADRARQTRAVRPLISPS